MQSVFITTKVVRSNPDHGEVYSKQHYLINIVSDFGRSVVFSVYSTNKTDHHDICGILLKVALNILTIKLL